MKRYAIICIDDEPIILESLKIELKRAIADDCLIETALDGEDALDLLSELLEDKYEVALVICDYIMPDIKGDELLKQIHAISPNTIKIMLTGQADIEVISNAIKHAKLYRYIAKPWQTEDLNLTVKEAIRSYFKDKQLEEQNTQLQRLNEELENLIEQRTAALRQSEEKFAKAFRSTPHAITITRLDNGLHIEVNDSFCRMTGYTNEEIIGRTALDLGLWVNQEDRDRLFKLLTHKGTVRDYEFNFRTRLGTIRTVLLSAEIIDIDGQTCVLNVSQDITERKQTEEELKKSEERWQLVLRGNKDGIWDRNLKTGEIFRSTQWKEMLGYEDDDIANTWEEWITRVHPDDLDRVIDANLKHLNKITPDYVVEYRLQCKNGSYKWVQDRGQALWDDQGKPVRFVGSHTDVTTRRQAEDSLRLAQFSLDNSADGAYWIGADGRFLYVNYAVCQALGYTLSELLTMSVPDIAPEFSNGIWPIHFNEQKQRGCPSTFETAQHRKDGSIFSVEITSQYLEFNGQEYICAFSRDITIRKQTELALQQAKEAADAANRAKSQFLANMSHELRTPLNAILGFTQLLGRDASLKPEQQEQLEIITRSGEHLLGLINNVLQMSKIEVGQVTISKNTFDLYRLLDSLEEMLQLQANKKGLQLIFDYAPNLPQYVQTDESKLRQVLINLLGNAIKFTSEGGVTLRVKAKQGSRESAGSVVRIGSRESEQEEQGGQEKISIEISQQTSPLSPPSPLSSHSRLPTSDSLIFEVQDTGPGISPEEMENLFQAFVQTETGRRTLEGTGLGLPISRQFVQLMGGDITVSSTVGKGSIFKFDVEIDVADAVEIQETQATHRVIGLEPEQPEYRILVVDDRLESRLLLVRLLESVGFRACAAENGQEAIEQWQDFEPQLIWMDMRMPVMDGYEATKRIKAHLKGQATVIIALTASAFDEERSVVLSAGCDDFVAKPFREQVIFDKMAQYLGVSYVYEEPHSSTLALAQVTPMELSPEALAVMPSEWVNKLYEAADSVDNEEIFRLLLQIPDSHGDLGDAIADLVNNFRCDRIIELIEEFNSPPT